VDRSARWCTESAPRGTLPPSPPEESDVVSLFRERNRLGVAYVAIGGFAINRPGLVGATKDPDPPAAQDRAGQVLEKSALGILPDRAIGERGAGDIAEWIVVRLSDDIAVGLVTEACGFGFEEAATSREREEIGGVSIPFVSAEGMLRSKPGSRATGGGDRSFLERPIRTRPLTPPQGPRT
jgi:hypothetical protein